LKFQSLSARRLIVDVTKHFGQIVTNIMQTTAKRGCQTESHNNNNNNNDDNECGSSSIDERSSNSFIIINNIKLGNIFIVENLKGEESILITI
jgi:hypothetical protein